MVTVAPLSQAAELTLKLATSPADVEILTWIWLMVFSIGGWGASSFAKLAGWFGGTKDERFKLVQNVWVSIVAGVLAFFGGQMLGQTEMACMVAAGFAAFAGDKYLSARIGGGGNPQGPTLPQIPPDLPRSPQEGNGTGTP